jgi:rare lipoprotein A
MVGCAIAATSVCAAAAGTARADHPPVRERDPAKAAAGVEGWRRDVEPSSKARRDAGVWAVVGAGALGVPSDRPDTAFDLEGRTLGPVSAVTVVAKGKAHVVVTNARTVGELLSAMRIQPGEADRVDPPPGTPLTRTRRVVVSQPAPAPQAESTAAGGSLIGRASWYHVDSDLTAASPWLPFGTVVTVTSLATGARVTVVINDRGPFGGRIIDLSEAAFARIAPLGQGVASVRLTW